MTRISIIRCKQWRLKGLTGCVMSGSKNLKHQPRFSYKTSRSSFESVALPFSGQNSIYQSRTLRTTVSDGHTIAMEKLMLDDDTAALVLAVKGLLKDLRERGLNDDEIDALVRRNGPGRIVLDRNGILTLPDYGDVKIYLNPIERTLYTLLLRYDKGIAADDIWMYYDELCDIYRRQTVYDDPTR